MNEENPEIQELMGEINACKILLADTDYIALKVAEGVTTRDGEYATQLANRAAWRQKINDCEAEIAQIQSEAE